MTTTACRTPRTHIDLVLGINLASPLGSNLTTATKTAVIWSLNMLLFTRKIAAGGLMATVHVAQRHMTDLSPKWGVTIWCIPVSIEVMTTNKTCLLDRLSTFLSHFWFCLGEGSIRFTVNFDAFQYCISTAQLLANDRRFCWPLSFPQLSTNQVAEANYSCVFLEDPTTEYPVMKPLFAPV
jgi:hypothetical protein